MALSAALEPVVPDPSLPVVWTGGDSVSMGWVGPLREALSGEASVLRPNENCSTSAYWLERLEHYWWPLGQARGVSVVVFNMGLHDIMPHRAISQSAYGDNLDALVVVLRRLFPRAQLLFVNTSFVGENPGTVGRDNANVILYNGEASTRMAAQGVPVLDMYALCAANYPAWYVDEGSFTQDDEHMNDTGKAAQGAWLAGIIRGYL